MGQVPLAGEETQERTAMLRDVRPDRALERRIAGLERVEHGRDRDRARDFQRYLALRAGESAQGCGDLDADHRTASAASIIGGSGPRWTGRPEDHGQWAPS